MNGFEIQCLPGAPGALEVTNVGATSGNTSPAEWFLDWAAMGQSSDSGVKVNGYTALTNCALWQGVQTIAGDVAQVPVRLVRNEFDDQRHHPAWRLLRLRPNALQTPSVYTETMIQWSLIWGNALAWIVKIGSRPSELIPLRPDCVWPELVAFDEHQVILYHYWSPTTGREMVFSEHQVVHIQGLTGDGIWGYPLHEIAKNTIGHGLALERYGNRIFKNSARPSGVLKHPGKMSPEARANLRQEWESLHSGHDNVGRVAILQEAIDFQTTSMTNIDAQWIEAKKASAVDSARLLNLPPYKLNIMDDSANRANLEEQNADYTQRTLSRHFNRLAEEYRRKLLTEKEWLSDEYQFVYDVDSFLKADIDTLSNVADRLVKSTILNPNEARRKYFQLPPRKGGDIYGSPAINPNKDLEQKTPEKEPENPPKVETHAAHKELLVDRAAHLIECETSRLRHAAASSPNFIAWLDEFYLGNGRDSKLRSIYDAVMGKSVNAACAAGMPAHDIEAAVAAWGLHRRKMIMDACSLVSQSGLAEMIESFVVRQPQETAEQLLLTVLEGK